MSTITRAGSNYAGTTLIMRLVVKLVLKNVAYERQVIETTLIHPLVH